MFPYQEAQCSDRYVGGCDRIHLDTGEVSHHQPAAGQVDVQVALVGGVIRYRHQVQGGLTGCWEVWVSCLKLEGGVGGGEGGSEPPLSHHSRTLTRTGPHHQDCPHCILWYVTDEDSEAVGAAAAPVRTGHLLLLLLLPEQLTTDQANHHVLHWVVQVILHNNLRPEMYHTLRFTFLFG